MFDEEQYAKTIKSLLLALLNQEEETAALLVVLRESDLLDPVLHESARQRVKLGNREKRESIEKIGVQSVGDFLRSYEGPIQ